MRERLYELIIDAENAIYRDKTFVTDTERIEKIADHLLANGVIVPPIFVGSTVYYIYDLLGEICVKEMRVVECTFDEQGLYSLRADSFDHHMSLPFSRNHPYYSLNTLRYTKAEAEKALSEMNKEGEG